MARGTENEIAEKPVRRVLRRRGTQDYYKDDGWTNNPEDARNFSDVLEAAQTCVQFGLNDVELALRVESEEVFCTAIR